MRKLAFIMFSFAAAAAIAEYLLPDNMPLVFTGVFALAGAVSLFIKSEKKLAFVLIFFGLSFGMLWYFVYGMIFYTPAELMDGKTETVEAVVSNFPEETEYGSRAEIKVKVEGYPPVKTRLYVYDEIPAVKPGDKITFPGKFTAADKIYGEKTEVFTSKGYFLFVYLSGEISIERAGKSETVKYFPQYMVKEIKDKINEIFPENTKGFTTALLTGDNAALQKRGSISNDMSVTGVYHVVAVSGMHLVYLASFLNLLIRRKKTAAIVTIPVLILFMAMIGFTPSVTRAGIMQIMLLVAPLLKRESDPITALSFALGVILLFNPYSIANVGLQLSFGASLGIILVTNRIFSSLYGRVKKTRLCKGRIGKAVFEFVISNFSVTVGASVFTIPLVAVHFGYASLIAPVTNLAVLWAVSLAFGFSAVACILGFIFTPIGAAAAYMASIPSEYFMIVVQLLAKLKFAAVYTSNMFFVCWIVFIYLAGAAFAILKCRLRQIILPMSIAVSSLCVVFILSCSPIKSENLELTALDVGQGQSLVITSGDYTALIDCGSSSGEDAGGIASDFLIGEQRNEIDLLVLTHFHADHANGVEKLMDRIEIDVIAVPKPDLEENDYSDSIIELARGQGVDIIYITENISASFGKSKINIFSPLAAGNENENGLCVLCTEGSYDILVTGDINSNLERQLVSRESIPDTEVLVAGHHGSKYSSCEEFIDSITPEYAIISVGRNSYGHPAQVTIDRFEDNKIEVYRTDRLGNITISTG